MISDESEADLVANLSDMSESSKRRFRVKQIARVGDATDDEPVDLDPRLASSKENQYDEDGSAQDEYKPIVACSTVTHIQVFIEHLKEAIFTVKYSCLCPLQ